MTTLRARKAAAKRLRGRTLREAARELRKENLTWAEIARRLDVDRVTLLREIGFEP